MRPRPASLVVALALGACGRGDSRPVVALNYPAWGVPFVTVAETLLARHPGLGTLPRFVVDTADRREDAAAMTAWAQRLADLPRVAAVVGPSNSRNGLTTAPVFNAAGIPQVIPSATSRLLQHAGPWTFLLAPDDSLEGLFIADHVAGALRARRVAVFYENDEYGQGLRDAVVTALAARGVAVLGETPVLPESDFDALVRAAFRAGRPDAVVAATRDVGAATIATLVARLSPGIPVVAGDAALGRATLHPPAGAAADLRLVAFWVPDTTDPVQREYLAVAGRILQRTPTADDAMTQDALMMLVTAIHDVGPDRGAIRDWLRSLGRERPPFPGITGPIAFGVGGAGRMRMVRPTGGRIVPVTAP
jgi:branched-chain amino acid transport system substrate-binding protein